MHRLFKLVIFQFFLLFQTVFFLPSLEFTDVYGSLSDAFLELIDSNEGMTVFRSLYIPAGGRAESMGSAFTGLANDIGFLEFNPAASSVLESTELAVFHNAWIADSAVETIAYTMRNRNFGWGTSLKCFYVPFTEYNIFGERASGGYYSETTATLNFAYNFLAGYDFKGLAVGFNLKASYRSVPDYSNDATMQVIEDSGLSQSAIGIMGDLGFQLRFNLAKFYISREPNFQVGLVFSNLGAAFTGFGSQSEVVLDDALPTRVAFGVSYKMIRPVTVTLEFRQPINLQDISLSEQWSAGAGCSVQCTDFFSFQAGFLLSGANPRFSIGSEFLVQGFLINANYTFDMTSSINPVNRISISAKMNLGDRGRKALQDKIDALYSEGLKLYTEGKLEEAIIVWQEILNYDAGFDPAIVGIEAAEDSLNLLKSIREFQMLD